MEDELLHHNKWTWNWTNLCGMRGGLRPLNPDTNDIGLCFQQLCLQIPTLALLAIASAYYCGKKTSSVHYDRFTHYAITLRLAITACLFFLPIMRAYIILTNTTLYPPQPPAPLNTTILPNNQQTSAKPIDYLVAGTEGLAWMVHFCFILTLKRGTRLSIRGPVIIRALIFMLIGISSLLLRTHAKHDSHDDVLPHLSLGFSISVVTLMVIYAFTLLPNLTNYDRTGQGLRYSEIGEHTSLLNSPTSSYIHFPDQQDANYLGTAMEEATVLSKLLFHWVTPLMEKGVRGSLKHPDDLYDLPEHITTTNIVYKIEKHIRKTPKTRTNILVEIDQDLPASTALPSNNISLFRLLHQCFGWQFYLIGILKFIADCSGFVGPILLNRLVGFIEDKNEPVSYGYLYAALMFIATVIGELS